MENNETILSNIDLLTKLKASIQITTHELLKNLDDDVNVSATKEIGMASKFGIVTMFGLTENIIDAEIQKLKQHHKNNQESREWSFSA
jgi:hypothetical protein